MARKEDLVQDILSITDKYSKDELMGLTNKQLVAKLNEVQKEVNVKKEKEVPVEVSPQIQTTFDKEALEKEIYKKVMLEMREKMGKELKEKILAESDSNATPIKKKVTEIDKHKDIPVMNLTNGTLIYVSKKTGAEYLWESYGDVAYLEFQELQAIRTSSKAFIYDPLFMILDDDVVNYLGLESLYDKILDLDDLDSIFKMNNELFKEFMEKAPKSIVISVITRARQKVEENTLDSMYKVNYLNEKFNTDIGKRG